MKPPVSHRETGRNALVKSSIAVWLTDTPLEYAILIRVPSSAHPGQEVTIALVFFLDETDLKY